MNYDIFGDIHGQADKLIQLLEKLGYRKENNCYQKAGHQAIFVGDFIDRGTGQKAVIDIVRPMIDNKKALAIMGNHEFNAICYHTKNSDSSSSYLRPHSEKNKKQHLAFLNEYPLNSPETNELIDWFKSLPLYLELDDFRVIHACFDQQIIDDLKLNNFLTDDNCLLDSCYHEASTKGTILYEAIEVLLKGKEILLPTGMSFRDKDGNERHEIRIKWWENSLKTYQEATVLKIKSLSEAPDINIPEKHIINGYLATEKPVFFGHYWFSGKPERISENVACLDYSAGNGGALIAYQWMKGSLEINNDSFISSE
ncbi:MAG: metallophosphoesterase [Mycoplasmataceae bacterium]|nr:metallophosphoesterase [Mycoplasmataceae bacterium]